MAAMLQSCMYTLIINPWGACAARVTVLSLRVCVYVPSLTATPLMYEYKVKYESKANVVLKVFALWISLKINRL